MYVHYAICSSELSLDASCPQHPPLSAVRLTGHKRTPSASFRSPPAVSPRSLSPAKPSGSVPPPILLSTARASRLGQGSPTKPLSGLSLQPRRSFPRQSPGQESTAPPSPSALPIRNFESPVQLPVPPSGQPPRATSPPLQINTSRPALSPPPPSSSTQHDRVSLLSVTSPKVIPRPLSPVNHPTVSFRFRRHILYLNVPSYHSASRMIKKFRNSVPKSGSLKQNVQMTRVASASSRHVWAKPNHS
jgi:hypothetical protein